MMMEPAKHGCVHGRHNHCSHLRTWLDGTHFSFRVRPANTEGGNARGKTWPGTLDLQIGIDDMWWET
eukprot:7778028-Prorocentrum_lima.AAC.1